MLKIKLLKNCVEVIPILSRMWVELIGKKWMPSTSEAEVISWYEDQLNEDIPTTFVAFVNNEVAGTCSLHLKDGLESDFSPWLGDLLVGSAYQKQGIGNKLINTVKSHAKSLGYNDIYLFSFEQKVIDYYKKLGWVAIGLDTYENNEVTIMRISLN